MHFKGSGELPMEEESNADNDKHRQTRCHANNGCN